MDITNFTPIQSSQNIQGSPRPIGQSNVEPARQAASLKDTISFSEEALRLSDVTTINTESTRIRFDLVNRIKAEIAAGTYDTQDKMDIAIERMVSRVV